MKVDFIVIGAMKCGSTSLHDYYLNRPQVQMTMVKEPNFFSKDPLFDRGVAYYHSLWPGDQKRSDELYGEVSPNYTNHLSAGVAAERIYKYSPDVKLIYAVRHPIKRVISHWKHGHKGSPQKWADFAVDLQEEGKRDWLVERSRYQNILGYFLKYFPENQIKVIFLEDLISSPEVVLESVDSFLGLEALGTPPVYPHFNKSGSFDNVILEQATIDGLIEDLADDSKSFLSWCGKATDFWDLNVGVQYTL